MCEDEREMYAGQTAIEIVRRGKACVRRGAKILGRREKFVLNKQRITEISTFLTCRSLCLSVCLSVCSSVCLSVHRLSVCLFVLFLVCLCLMCLRNECHLPNVRPLCYLNIAPGAASEYALTFPPRTSSSIEDPPANIRKSHR